jgi:hypothetical protein
MDFPEGDAPESRPKHIWMRPWGRVGRVGRAGRFIFLPCEINEFDRVAGFLDGGVPAPRQFAAGLLSH